MTVVTTCVCLHSYAWYGYSMSFHILDCLCTFNELFELVFGTTIVTVGLRKQFHIFFDWMWYTRYREDSNALFNIFLYKFVWTLCIYNNSKYTSLQLYLPLLYKINGSWCYQQATFCIIEYWSCLFLAVVMPVWYQNFREDNYVHFMHKFHFNIKFLCLMTFTMWSSHSLTPHCIMKNYSVRKKLRNLSSNSDQRHLHIWQGR